MRRWHKAALAAAAVTALTVAAAGATPASAHDDEGGGYTFAVIGDIPYGSTQIANFPKVVAPTATG